MIETDGRLDRIPCALLLALACFALFLLGAPREPTDTATASSTAVSLVHDHSLSVDRYVSEPVNGVVERDGRHYDGYPVTTALLLAPAVAAELAAGLSPRQVADQSSAVGRTTQAALGALIGALAVLFFFKLVRRRSSRAGTAVVMTAVFALATPVWSSASRLPWTNGTVLVLELGALLLLLREGTVTDIAAGVCLGVAAATRPTAAAALVLLAAWTAPRKRRRLVGVGVGALVGAAPFVLLTVVMFGTMTAPYYSGHHLQRVSLESVAGPLLSPSRGLLVFAPYLLLLVPRFARRPDRSSRWWSLDLVLLGCAAAVWAAVASCSCGWWGGWSLGPRLFTESAAFLCFPLVPVVDAMVARSGRRLWRALSGASLAWAVVLNAVLVLWPAGWYWNSQPNNVDHHQSRLWDWTDPPWLRH